MLEYMTDPKDKNWQIHFNRLIQDSDFPELNEFDPIVPKIQTACQALAKAAKTFKRQTLQTRFFETGDNYYLGMQFCCSFLFWYIMPSFAQYLSFSRSSLFNQAWS
jgi:hypothetical protein